MALSPYCAPPKPKGRLLIQTLRIMRLMSFFLFVAIMQVSAKTYSQKVSLSLTDVPLKTVFIEINAQTGYNFIYFDETLAATKNVTLHVSNTSIEDVLTLCFKDQPLSFTVQNNSIVIKAKQNIQPSDKPPIDIHGRVTDSLGNPLAGASVSIKGSKRGTITNAQGDFALSGVSDNAKLIISFTGFGTREFKMSGKQDFNIVLSRISSPLDEVQVIAYGTTTKRLSTGDVTTVNADVIERQPVTNVLSALEGRVAGLFVSQTNGLPGSSYQVRIQGQNSIVNGNDPFYVIDGVPYISQMLPGLGQPLGYGALTTNGLTYGSPLSFINPGDIESVTILKDADATAIYGSRGANGVILITTKKGVIGKTKLNINANTGAGVVPHFMDLLNTPQYLEMRHEAFQNDNITPDINSAPDLLFWDTARYTNWQKTLIGGTANYTDIQGSVSGGNANTQYLIGGGYQKQTTVIPGSFSDQKGSAHVSVNSTSIDQKFKMSFSGSYLVDHNTLPSGDPTSNIRLLAPDAPSPHNPDGTFNWAYLPGTTNSTWTADQNPLSFLLSNYIAQTNNLVSNAVFSYNLLPGLILKANLGYTNMQVKEISTYPVGVQDPAQFPASSSAFVNNNNSSWIVEPQIGYKINIGKGRLDALLGSTFTQSNSEGQDLIGINFSSDALLMNIQAASSVYVQSVIDDEYKYNAFFGQVNYNWQEKYILNLTGRRDGSSRFGPDNQFHNFGAIGAAWIFSNEEFLKNNISFLSFGKLRGSYGTSGNDQIGDYRFYDLYQTNGNLPYQGVGGLTPTNLFNPNLAWEEVKKLEGGLDLGFFKDRVLFTLIYFDNRSSNQLVNYSLPAVTGFNSVSENLPAVVQNTGTELTLNTVNIKSGTFTWSTSFNLTALRNKLVAFPNLVSSTYSSTYIIGQPLNIQKVYQYAGVDPNTGLYVVKDKQGNTTANPDYTTDRSSIENTNPEFYGGLENTFEYKGFRLDVFFQFVKQRGGNPAYGFNSAQPGARGYNFPVQVLDRWQKTGDNKPFEMYSTQYGDAYNALSYNLTYSTGNYTDASFIRLKNVSLSYQLSESIVKKMHLRQLEVYVLGQNLFTITHHYIGYDPETQSTGSLPILRIITGGIKLGL